MGTFSRLFLFALAFFSPWTGAHSRLPETASEHSLLYWRYLCRGQPQEEVLKQSDRELKCMKQGWTVRTPASSGQVKEIITHDAP